MPLFAATLAAPAFCRVRRSIPPKTEAESRS